MRHASRCAALSAMALLVAGGAAIAQQSPYSATDGDAAVMLIVQNGAIRSTVSTFTVGEAIAVRSTVMPCDCDQNGMGEETLAGALTGRTFPGADVYSQLLDRTTDGVGYKYTIAWSCANPDPVLRYDLDWQNSTVLFYLPAGVHAIATTYDTKTNHLSIAFDGEATIREFDLSGNQVWGTVGGSLVRQLPGARAFLPFTAGGTGRNSWRRRRGCH
ncbi:MAG TPA: hypothetical protein VMT19_04520 [Thermoanaerobaculaceae bacterium]|nr:hypothetical protein [Thermoanaerobaculaceae bacterium]